MDLYFAQRTKPFPVILNMPWWNAILKQQCLPWETNCHWIFNRSTTSSLPSSDASLPFYFVLIFILLFLTCIFYDLGQRTCPFASRGSGIISLFFLSCLSYLPEQWLPAGYVGHLGLLPSSQLLMDNYKILHRDKWVAPSGYIGVRVCTAVWDSDERADGLKLRIVFLMKYVFEKLDAWSTIQKLSFALNVIF